MPSVVCAVCLSFVRLVIELLFTLVLLVCPASLDALATKLSACWSVSPDSESLPEASPSSDEVSPSDVLEALEVELVAPLAPALLTERVVT